MLPGCAWLLMLMDLSGVSDLFQASACFVLIGAIGDHASVHNPWDAVVNDREPPGAAAEKKAEKAQDK